MSHGQPWRAETSRQVGMGQGPGTGHDARQMETCLGSAHGAGMGAAAMRGCARLGRQLTRLARGAQPARARLGQAWSVAAPRSAKAEQGGWRVGWLLGVGGSSRNVSLRHAGSCVGVKLPAALHGARPPPCSPKPAPCASWTAPQTLHPAPQTLHLAPQNCTLHPVPCIVLPKLFPASSTSHPAPQTLHPKTCTLHLVPCTPPAQTPTQTLLTANLTLVHPVQPPSLTPPCILYPETHTQKPACALWTPCTHTHCPPTPPPLPGAHLPTVPSLLALAAGAGGRMVPSDRVPWAQLSPELPAPRPLPPLG